MQVNKKPKLNLEVGFKERLISFGSPMKPLRKIQCQPLITDKRVSKKLDVMM
jgi:hypothetical protein